MPESVTDRPTKSHEYVFLLSKSPRYYYDGDAIREPQSEGTHERFGKNPIPSSSVKLAKPGSGVKNNTSFHAAMKSMILPAGRNRRSVWEIATEAYPEAHFATYPQALVEPCIKAGTSERGVCPQCGAPWERVVERSGTPASYTGKDKRFGNDGNGMRAPEKWNTSVTTLGWKPTCTHDAEPVPATVLDPFLGSGTTAWVAKRLGRHAIGIDLNAEYLDLAISRNRQKALL